jgi:glycosyltransferase involved in cell wall biosynthesis
VLSEERLAFWQTVFATAPPNVHFVFVSRYFAEEVITDVGVELAAERYSVIHNPIDTGIFTYDAKPVSQRTKVLSIRSFASAKYANDLTVAAIEELRDESWFGELEFRIIGDGALFDETLAPVRGMENVHIERRFLNQAEIAHLHKQYGVFMVPTRMDAQGVSRDEAMSSGLVPLTNAVAAIPEFVDERCGFLTEADDHCGLASAIRALRSDPELFERMSRAAASRVRSQSAANLVIKRELGLVTSGEPVTDE